MANRNMLKGAAIAALAIGLLVTGCASQPAPGLLGPAPAVGQTEATLAKTGKASAKVWLGIFGTTSFPEIADAAKAGGITKVATVEYYQKPGILGLWTEYTTVVNGE